MLSSGVRGSLAHRRHRADDLPDRHDKEELSGYGLHYRQHLTWIGCRYQVSVTHRGYRHETEKEVLAERAAARMAEKRNAAELSDRPVGEREEHPEQQVRGNGTEQ